VSPAPGMSGMSGTSGTTVATVGEALADRRLPALEIRMLLQAVTDWPVVRLLAHPETPLTTDTAAHLEALVARRIAGEPMAYLLGTREFYGRAFAIDARVLIPRPETELLVERALQCAPHAAAVLDLGTGSGAIAVTLACERPDLQVTALDASAAALEVARVNALALGARVSTLHSDWYAALPAAARFALIVANPPYIAAHDPHLQEGDLRHEPRGALTEEGDGLGALRHIIAGAPGRLHPGGALLLEHGHDQAAAVRALLAAAGFSAVASHRDLAGIERVTGGVCDTPPATVDLPTRPAGLA